MVVTEESRAEVPIAVFSSSTHPVMRSSSARCTPPISAATISSSAEPSLLLAPFVAVTVAAAAFTSALDPLSSTPAPTAIASAGHG